MLFFIALCLTCGVVVTQPPPNDGDGLVVRYCGTDIRQYCHNVGGPREIIECLENHKSGVALRLK
jgi:hypothetical protein